MTGNIPLRTNNFVEGLNSQLKRLTPVNPRPWEFLNTLHTIAETTWSDYIAQMKTNRAIVSQSMYEQSVADALHDLALDNIDVGDFLDRAVAMVLALN